MVLLEGEVGIVRDPETCRDLRRVTGGCSVTEDVQALIAGDDRVEVLLLEGHFSKYIYDLGNHTLASLRSYQLVS